MGNQPSSSSTKERRQSSSGDGPSLDTYPSFSKTDTRESTRSFRGSIRNKIPGSRGQSAEPSPRPSTSEGPSRVASIASSATEKEEADVPSQQPAVSSPEAKRSSVMADNGSSKTSDLQPPSSPTMSPSVGTGHSNIDDAKAVSYTHLTLPTKRIV